MSRSRQGNTSNSVPIQPHAQNCPKVSFPSFYIDIRSENSFWHWRRERYCHGLTQCYSFAVGVAENPIQSWTLKRDAQETTAFYEEALDHEPNKVPLLETHL